MSSTAVVVVCLMGSQLIREEKIEKAPDREKKLSNLENEQQFSSIYKCGCSIWDREMEASSVQRHGEWPKVKRTMAPSDQASDRETKGAISLYFIVLRPTTKSVENPSEHCAPQTHRLQVIIKITIK